jgi:hypothetical protein
MKDGKSLRQSWLDFSWAARFAILSSFFGAAEAGVFLFKTEMATPSFAYISFGLMLVSGSVKAASVVFASAETKTEARIEQVKKSM